MHLTLRTCILCLCLSGFYTSSIAQSKWTQLPQLFGSGALQFDSDDTELYVLTYGGIYKNTNSGANWSLVKGSEQFGSIGSQFQVEKGIFYVLNFASGQTALYRSTNGGLSWQAILAPPYPLGLSNELPTHLFVAGDTILVGSNLTIYRSIDQGNSWQYPPVNIAGAYKGWGKIKDDLFVAREHIIFKSIDGGLSWDKNFTAGYSFAGFTAVDTILYALYDGYPRLIRSDNSGMSWDKIDSDSIEFYTFNDETNDWLTGSGQKLFYASDYWCTHGGIQMFNSPDGGDEWMKTNRSGLERPTMHDLKALPDQLLAASPHGVYRSDDDGASFYLHNEGINAAWIREIFKISDSVWWADTRHGIFSTTDKGQNWTFQLPGELGEPCYIERPIFMKTQKRFFYKDPYIGTISYSEDQGQSWTDSGFPPFFYVSDMVAEGNTVWFSQNNNIYRFKDEDTSPELLPNPPNSTSVYELKAHGNLLYARYVYDQYISHDRGHTWTTMPQFFNGSFPDAGYFFHIDDKAIFRLFNSGSFNGTYNIYYLNFNENIWRPFTPINAVTGDTLVNTLVRSLETGNNKIWFLGEPGYGLYYSTDHSGNFYPFTPALPNLFPTAIYLDETDLWVGTSNAGIFTADAGIVSSSAPFVQKPDQSGPQFAVSPNPSPGLTRLSSDVFISEKNALRVFDATGHLVWQTALAPGLSWALDLSQLPAGIYLWQIQTALGTKFLKWVKG